MVLLLLLLTFFAALRFFVVLANAVTRQWLRPQDSSGKAGLSILVPARNEEKNITGLLRNIVETHDHASQRNVDVPGHDIDIEIIVYDDQSTDGTADAVVAAARDLEAEGLARPGMIRLVRGGALPEGWLGKNHACHRLAGEARGDWLLFLDADVEIDRNLLKDSLGYARKKSLGLLSVFPRQIMKTTGEWMVVPLMNWILVSLLPMVLIRKCRWTSFAAANGQFMLFDAAVYRKFHWHEQVKSDPVEDIRISRLMKKNKLRTATMLSGGQISCRMYEGYRQALNGFSKNIGQFFGNSMLWMLFFTLMTTLFPLVLITLFFPSCPPALLPYFFFILGIRIGTSALSRQDIFRNLIFWIPQQIILLVLVVRSLNYRSGRKIEWKGRHV
jgi:glycosyltransferase involved in cell wall biosynthesis